MKISTSSKITLNDREHNSLKNKAYSKITPNKPVLKNKPSIDISCVLAMMSYALPLLANDYNYHE